MPNARANIVRGYNDLDLSRCLRARVPIALPAGMAAPVNWLQERRLEIPLPTDQVIESLFLRIAGNLAIGVADATNLQPQGMRRVLRGLDLRIKGPRFSDLLRSYQARGVNDGAAGRACSFAGVQVAHEAAADMGCQITQTDPGVVVGAQATEIVFPIRFIRPRCPMPYASLLDTRELESATLIVNLGIMDTTAAGDDTDVLVTAATTTAVYAGAVELSADVWTNVPRYPFDYRRILTYSAALDIREDLPVDLGAAKHWIREHLLVTDNDVLSDVRVTDTSFRAGSGTYIVDRVPWAHLRSAARTRYQLEAFDVGQNFIDQDPEKKGEKISTGGQKAYVVARVPAGAVAAQDRIFVTGEDLVLNV